MEQVAVKSPNPNIYIYIYIYTHIYIYMVKGLGLYVYMYPYSYEVMNTSVSLLCVSLLLQKSTYSQVYAGIHECPVIQLS